MIPGKAVYIVSSRIRKPENVKSCQAPAKTVYRQATPMNLNNYFGYQVNRNGSALEIAQAETGNWKICLNWRKEDGSRITAETILHPGDVLYRPSGEARETLAGTNYRATAPSFKKPQTYQPTTLAFNQPKKLVATNYQTAPTQSKKETKKKDLDWNSSVGYSQYRDLNAGENVNREGYNYHGKMTVYPWQVDNWKVGPEVRYNYGKSEVGKPGYQAAYKYNRLEAGIRAETHKDHQTTGFEVGISKQNTNLVGTGQGQDTWSAHARADYEDKRRRAAGEKWFPAFNVSGEYRQQLDGDAYGGASEYNESTLGARERIGIYDFNPGDSGLRITPELNAEAGYTWGKKSALIGAGPGFSVGDKKNEFAEVRFLNPRIYLQDKGSSRLEEFAITLKPDDIFRAAEAAQIEEYNGNSIKKFASSEEEANGH